MLTTNGPCSPLFEVMKVFYDVLRRLEKAGRLPWPSEKEVFSILNSDAVQHRIRKAAKAERPGNT
jgi:hypothetical protein